MRNLGLAEKLGWHLPTPATGSVESVREGPVVKPKSVKDSCYRTLSGVPN